MYKVHVSLFVKLDVLSGVVCLLYILETILCRPVSLVFPRKSMFLFDHGGLPQVGRVVPHGLRDFEHLMQSVRVMHSMTSSDNR